jgi:hypothetical protein
VWLFDGVVQSINDLLCSRHGVWRVGMVGVFFYIMYTFWYIITIQTRKRQHTTHGVVLACLAGWWYVVQLVDC